MHPKRLPHAMVGSSGGAVRRRWVAALSPAMLGATVLVWLLAAGPQAAAAAATCMRLRVAQVPLRDDAGFLSVPASISGEPVRLMLDTGSEAGLITPEAARALRLDVDRGARVSLQGTGGNQAALAVARASGLSVGSLQLDGVLLPVGALPGAPRLHPPVVGFLGGDVLSRFDLDIDLPHGRLSFWRIRTGSLACARPPAWKGGFRTLPLLPDGVRVSLTVLLNGHPLSALLDTGARSRVLSEAAARALGVAPSILASEPGGVTSGVDMREQIYHWHRFATFSVGGETERGAVLTVAPLHGLFPMLLGTDWLQGREVWVSYSGMQLFIR